MGHAHVLFHHGLAQRLHVGLDVRIVHVAAVLADRVQTQLFYVTQYDGRLLADAHFALKLLHPLFQCAVAAGQHRALPFQVTDFLLHLRRAPQLISDIVTFFEPLDFFLKLC